MLRRFKSGMGPIWLTVFLCAVAATGLKPSSQIQLFGIFEQTGKRTTTLSGVFLDLSTNVVTGTVTVTDARPILSYTDGRFSACSFDQHERPLRITAHPLPVRPVFDAVANTLTWHFTFQVPPGRTFGGVHLDGGYYRFIHEDSGKLVQAGYETWMDWAYGLE